jgi:hypothetical protein
MDAKNRYHKYGNSKHGHIYLTISKMLTQITQTHRGRKCIWVWGEKCILGQMSFSFADHMQVQMSHLAQKSATSEFSKVHSYRQTRTHREKRARETDAHTRLEAI